MSGHRERKSLIKKLDKLFSDVIRERAEWQCQRCLRSFMKGAGGLQCAHIFTRSRLSTRWDIENAVALCGGCHLYWAHKYPYDFYEWIERDVLGTERFKALRTRSNLSWRVGLSELKLLAGQLEERGSEAFRGMAHTKG